MLRISITDFQCDIQVAAEGDRRAHRSLPFWPLPGQEKPEAGLEVLEQSSYLSAEGCTHTEPAGIVTAAAQDFTDLACGREQLNHHSVKAVSQPGRQKVGRGM